MMIAEGVELLVAAVFAVDNQRLIIRHIISLAQIFKNGRHFGREAFREKLVADVSVFLVFAGNEVKRALAMARVHADGRREGIDFHASKKRAALGELVTEKRGISGLRFDGLAAPGAAAEPDEEAWPNQPERRGRNLGRQ